MTNEDATIEILDKLGWDYDMSLNPNRYRNTPCLMAGELILSILNSNSIESAAKSLGFSYKAVNTAVTRYFVPIFGSLNGGEQTWRFVLTHYIQARNCSKCDLLLKYTEYHLDSSSVRGISNVCKSCTSIISAGSYSRYIISHRKSYEKNAGKIKARHIIQTLNRSKRIVPWSEKEDIARFYHECPEGYHVDHIIPLQGKEVSGLHVLANLQYLPASENIAKGNRFIQ